MASIEVFARLDDDCHLCHRQDGTVGKWLRVIHLSKQTVMQTTVRDEWPTQCLSAVVTLHRGGICFAGIAIATLHRLGVLGALSLFIFGMFSCCVLALHAMCSWRNVSQCSSWTQAQRSRPKFASK